MFNKHLTDFQAGFAKLVTDLAQLGQPMHQGGSVTTEKYIGQLEGAAHTIQDLTCLLKQKIQNEQYLASALNEAHVLNSSLSAANARLLGDIESANLRIAQLSKGAANV